MTLTAATLAFDIINRSKNVQPCKYAPRGAMADAVVAFMGRPAGHELFITEAQANLFTKLGGQNAIIAVGEGEERFAGFVKSIYSDKTKKSYFLLCFCGHVPAAVEAPVNSSSNANDFAAKLITEAINSNRAEKDKYAKPGEDDYLCVWIPPAKAEALYAQLPPEAIKPNGQFLTQACGAFAYWGKMKTMKGAVLLCWMGNVPASKPEVAIEEPKNLWEGHIPEGKLIPLDNEVPF